MPRKEDYESGKPYMDLPDYSGEFIKGLRYEDFSKETLAKMYNAAGKLILMMDKCWQDLIAEKYGWDEAVACEIEVWTKRLSVPIPAIMHDALGITGQNDVQALMKHNQFDATWPYPLFECDYDMPDKELERKELQRIIQDAISSLPENQRAVIVLRRYHMLSYQEIANVLETTVSAVESRLHRAKQNLRKILKSVQSEI